MNDTLRARAIGMVDAHKSDGDIDQEIMYSDHADREIIWQNVLDYRAELASKPPRDAPGPDPDGLISLGEIEAKRLELARTGRHHGYDSLAKACGVDKSTIVRRYKGRTPPGEAPF